MLSLKNLDFSFYDFSISYYDFSKIQSKCKKKRKRQKPPTVANRLPNPVLDLDDTFKQV